MSLYYGHLLMPSLSHAWQILHGCGAYSGQPTPRHGKWCKFRTGCRLRDLSSGSSTAGEEPSLMAPTDPVGYGFEWLPDGMREPRCESGLSAANATAVGQTCPLFRSHFRSGVEERLLRNTTFQSRGSAKSHRLHYIHQAFNLICRK